jgi:MFS family permease
MSSNHPQTISAVNRLQEIFRALKHRNFRLFFYGQGFSLVGTWMQQVAMSWLIYRLTQSTFHLGVVAFAGQFPGFILAPFAGIMADRFSRHKLLMAIQVLSMVEAFILAALTLTGVIEVWHILVLSVFAGLIAGIDIPVRQAFVVEMLDTPEDLSNAIALNSTAFNAARLVGPSIAGVTIALWGEGISFLLNGISFVAVLLALLAMRLRPQAVGKGTVHVFQEIREGFRYAYRAPAMRATLLLVALVSLMGLPYIVMMPVFAKDVLQGGPDTLGFLMGATGVGALAAAVYLATRRSVIGIGIWIAGSAGLMGVGLVLFSLSRLFWLSMGLMVLIGFGMMVQFVASNILLQTLVDEDKRGRVMSLYTMSFLGMSPLGSLLAGWLGSIIGVPMTILLGGIACTMGGLLFAGYLPLLRQATRPILVEKGIISEGT